MKLPFFSLYRSLSSFCDAHTGKDKPIVYLHYSCVMEPAENLFRLSELQKRCDFRMTADSFSATELLRDCSTIPGIKKAASFLIDLLGRSPRSNVYLTHLYTSPDPMALVSENKDRPLVFVFYNTGACEEFASLVKPKPSDSCYLIFFNPRCVNIPNAIDFMYPFAVKLSFFKREEPRAESGMPGAAFFFRAAPAVDVYETDSTISANRKKEKKHYSETPLTNSAVSNDSYDPISNRPFTIAEKLQGSMLGGREADIFTVKGGNPDRIVKLYKGNRSKEETALKKQYLSDLACYEGFFGMRAIMPVSLLINTATQSVEGFTMRRAPGGVLRDEWMDGLLAQGRNAVFRNLFVLLLELRLFEMDMLDLSGNNLFISENDDVILIDADSLQTPHFTNSKGPELGLHPDIAETSAQWFRQQRHIDFSLSVLLFQCVMGGIDPLTSGEEIAGWIKNGDIFPYGVDDVSRVYKEYGSMWLELPPALRRAFVSVFTFKQDLTLDAWIDVFKRLRII